MYDGKLQIGKLVAEIGIRGWSSSVQRPLPDVLIDNVHIDATKTIHCTHAILEESRHFLRAAETAHLPSYTVSVSEYNITIKKRDC